MDFFNYISIHTKLVNIRNTLHVTHADIIYRTWGDKIEYVHQWRFPQVGR